MISHIMVRAQDVMKSKVFYDSILTELEHEPAIIDPKWRCIYYTRTSVVLIKKPIDVEPTYNGNGSTLGFVASKNMLVDKWHSAGLANGFHTASLTTKTINLSLIIEDKREEINSKY